MGDQPGSAECLGGLVVFSTPIKAYDKTVGILSSGWVLTEAPVYEKICGVAQMIGADEDILSSDMAEVKVITSTEAEYIKDFAGILSEMAKKSTEVQKVNAAATKAAEHRSDFLTNVSHEMRTSLNAILGMTEMALHKDMSDEAKEYVCQIRSSGRHLLTIINDILDYSNLSSGDMPIVEVKYEPLSLINDVAATVNSQIGSKEIEFTINLPMDFPSVLVGDNVRIQQILINLLNNAVKFTHSGHIGLHLETVPNGKNTVLLKAEVSDTGCGIKKENLDKLFNMFRQIDSKRTRNVEGTGLGLAISRKLLTLMNGNISVRSEPGKGSTFFFDLPQKVAGEPYSAGIQTNGLPAYVNIGNKYMMDHLRKDLSAVGAKITDISGNPSACGDRGYLIVSRERFGEDAKEILRTHPEIRGIILERYDSLEQFNNANIEVVHKPAYSMNLYAAMGREMVDKGTDVLLAPGMNIHRNPLCGRNFEYFSEDPLVTGKLAAAVVQGLQSAPVSACPKHFACNNQEYNRNYNNSVVSARALREIYLRGFEICIKEAHPKNLMTSYNKINGVWSHYNYQLCTALLREEWGYTGNVMTDWWMRYAASPEFPELRDNGYRVRAQVDVLMPGAKTAISKSAPNDGSLLATLGKPDGITLGELQRTAKNVLRMTLRTKFAGQYKD